MDVKNYLISSKKANPIIYAYIAKDGTGKPINEGYIKIGFTSRSDEPTKEKNAMKRIREQTHTAGLVPQILKIWDAYDKNGKQFIDNDVHDILEKHGHQQLMATTDDNEWYKCELSDIENAINELKLGISYGPSRTNTFKMRPEQEEAVIKTMEYYTREDTENKGVIPKFLWNAKMRFGKTFSTYQLAKLMNMSRILILTFKPAVQDSWMEDLNSHVDFDGWQFISEASAKESIDVQYNNADKSKPIVCFGSFQDFLGIDKITGGIKTKNEWVHDINWDLVVFDEYHFGAWRDNAKHLFNNENEDEMKEVNATNIKDNLAASSDFNETYLPITTNHYLFLSGTPFRALNMGEFVEDQIFSWTYSDEQRAKENWKGNENDNPYKMMPRIVMFTYQIDDITENIAYQGEFDEFDLNIFFKAEGSGLYDDKKAKNPAHFVNENDVQRWLDIMRGNFGSMSVASLKTDIRKIPLPYQDTTLREKLRHTIWYLPNVAACEAMYNLLHKSQNNFYCDENNEKYVICCAGKNVGNGSKALEAIRPYMNSPFTQQTITLSCGKLTTGVTVKPWTGIFMLRNVQSPENYFQAAFRVQSPWEIKDEYGNNQVVKPECYIFDFAINRALRQVADYSCKLQTADDSPEKKVQEFIKYLPILAFDGTSMQEANAQDILDWTMNGTTANLLARKWKDASLIHIDNNTLEKLLNSKKAQEAIDKIESWRNLRDDIQVLVTKSKAVKEAKTKKGGVTPEEKPEIDAAEKEIRNRRKEIQDKLLHFMSRLPVFMYMTDCREQTVNDVICTYEPDLFRLVTGLDTDDYKTFIELGVFDSAKMNAACGAFRRYEDSSMTYSGINKHEGEEMGLFDISISPENYKKMFGETNITIDSDGISLINSRTEE